MSTVRQGDLSRRVFLGCAACAAASAGVAAVGMSPAAATARLLITDTTRARRRVQPEAVFRVPTDKRIVALSFDDGPDPAYTPHVLDVLDQYKAKATFFVVGVNALAHRDLVAHIRTAGHSFGNHTYDHRDLERLGIVSPCGGRTIVDYGNSRSALSRGGGGEDREPEQTQSGDERTQASVHATAQGSDVRQAWFPGSPLRGYPAARGYPGGRHLRV